MALPRESRWLPTIKCSGCGNQVEISMMGEHRCSATNPTLSPPLDGNDQFEAQMVQSQNPKYDRTPPPIETGIAGRAYMHRGQLTPVSQPSQSRDASPVYSNKSSSPKRNHGPVRPSQTSDDCWPRPKSPSRIKRPGGYGGFGDTTQHNYDKALSSSLKDSLNQKVSEKVSEPVSEPFAASRQYPTTKASFPQRKDSLEKWVPPEDETTPPRVPEKDEYKGFGPSKGMQNKSKDTLNRSDTYHQPPRDTNYVLKTHRSPSTAGSYPDRWGGSHAEEPKKSLPRDISRRPPPRTSLIPENKSNSKTTVDLAAEFGIGNPYHKPSESVSSAYTNFSTASSDTTQSSPSKSLESQNTVGQRVAKRGANNYPASSKDSQPRGLRVDPDAASHRQYVGQMLESPYGISPRSDRFDGAPLNSPRGPPLRSYGSAPQENSYLNDYRNLRRQNTWESQRGQEKVQAVSRGDCKSCGTAITGKSISSADGRLTGKYHKACFVCSTCSASFSSSVFYVHGDKPYCEQHYHQLNGSLCGSCGRGIEGQYVEDEPKNKYHIKCFRCLDCGVRLADGYFEVDGGSYCERDAWKRVQAQGYAEQESYRGAPPRGAVGARLPHGLPDRPRPGHNGRPYPPPPNGSSNGGRLGVNTDPRMRMNKRMTRLGNMNM